MKPFQKEVIYEKTRPNDRIYYHRGYNSSNEEQCVVYKSVIDGFETVEVDDGVVVATRVARPHVPDFSNETSRMFNPEVRNYTIPSNTPSLDSPVNFLQLLDTAGADDTLQLLKSARMKLEELAPTEHRPKKRTKKSPTVQTKLSRISLPKVDFINPTLASTSDESFNQTLTFALSPNKSRSLLTSISCKRNNLEKLYSIGEQSPCSPSFETEIGSMIVDLMKEISELKTMCIAFSNDSAVDVQNLLDEVLSRVLHEIDHKEDEYIARLREEKEQEFKAEEEFKKVLVGELVDGLLENVFEQAQKKQLAKTVNIVLEEVLERAIRLSMSRSSKLAQAKTFIEHNPPRVKHSVHLLTNSASEDVEVIKKVTELGVLDSSPGDCQDVGRVIIDTLLDNVFKVAEEKSEGFNPPVINISTVSSGRSDRWSTEEQSLKAYLENSIEFMKSLSEEICNYDHISRLENENSEESLRSGGSVLSVIQEEHLQEMSRSRESGLVFATDVLVEDEPPRASQTSRRSFGRCKPEDLGSRNDEDDDDTTDLDPKRGQRGTPKSSPQLSGGSSTSRKSSTTSKRTSLQDSKTKECGKATKPPRTFQGSDSEVDETKTIDDPLSSIGIFPGSFKNPPPSWSFGQMVSSEAKKLIEALENEHKSGSKMIQDSLEELLCHTSVLEQSLFTTSSENRKVIVTFEGDFKNFRSSSSVIEGKSSRKISQDDKTGRRRKRKLSNDKSKEIERSRRRWKKMDPKVERCESESPDRTKRESKKDAIEELFQNEELFIKNTNSEVYTIHDVVPGREGTERTYHPTGIPMAKRGTSRLLSHQKWQQAKSRVYVNDKDNLEAYLTHGNETQEGVRAPPNSLSSLELYQQKNTVSTIPQPCSAMFDIKIAFKDLPDQDSPKTNMGQKKRSLPRKTTPSSFPKPPLAKKDSFLDTLLSQDCHLVDKFEQLKTKIIDQLYEVIEKESKSKTQLEPSKYLQHPDEPLKRLYFGCNSKHLLNSLFEEKIKFTFGRNAI